VYSAGHNLLTITVDDYLEEKRTKGGIIEDGDAATRLNPEPDKYGGEDAEIIKTRKWDEYINANPKYTPIINTLLSLTNSF